MGVDIVFWRSRIVFFNAKMLKTSENIALLIAVIIETALIIEGEKLNPGSGPNENLLINCKECGLIRNANQVRLISYY